MLMQKERHCDQLNLGDTNRTLPPFLHRKWTPPQQPEARKRSVAVGVV